MKKRAFLAIPALTLLAKSAYAEPGYDEPRWYAGLSGGVAFVDDIHTKGAFGLGGDELTHKPGFTGSAQFGYRVLRSVRMEVEGNWRQNDVNKLNGFKYNPGPGYYSAQNSYSLMGNAFYDYHNSSPITPYVGAGLGVTRIITSYRPPYFFSSESHRLKDWLLAYQFMAGINYEIRDSTLPIDLTLGYRYLTSQDGEVYYDTLPGNVTFNNGAQSWEMGIRLYFN